MKRTFLVIVGLVIGFVLAEIFRRPKLNRLAVLEAKSADEKERLAEYDRQWQEEVAALPFDERMEYELWEAGMRLNNWMPDVETWEDNDDAET